MSALTLRFVALAGLCLCSIGLHAEYNIIAGWDRQIFPAYVIATASVKPTEDVAPSRIGDPHGQIGVNIKATKPNEQVQISIACNEFLELTQFNCSLPEAGQEYEIYPRIRYNYRQLSQCKQATPATLSVKVQIGNEPAEESSINLIFRSINDCPLKVVEGENVVDTKFAFAAFVNEQHPFVDKLLREALDRGIVSRFVGYQEKDQASVLRQVYALWDVLVSRDVRYSDITATAADSGDVLSQHVRSIEETVNNSQANCVDGSVLFVSMLRKIGIHAGLVFKPGHCFVVFSTDEVGETNFGLETTLVGEVVDDPEELPEFLDEVVEEDVRGVQSWPSFIAALDHGVAQLEEHEAEFTSKENVDFEIIPINMARKIGVLPIPYDGRDQFVEYDHVAVADEVAMAEEEEEEAESEE